MLASLPTIPSALVPTDHTIGVLGTVAPEPAARGAVLVAVLMGVVLIAVIVLLIIRRRLFREDEPGAGDAPLSLSGLRTLRDEGKLTEEEFAKAAAVITKMSPGSNPLRDEIEKRQRERRDIDNDGANAKRG